MLTLLIPLSHLSLRVLRQHKLINQRGGTPGNMTKHDMNKTFSHYFICEIWDFPQHYKKPLPWNITAFFFFFNLMACIKKREKNYFSERKKMLKFWSCETWYSELVEGRFCYQEPVWLWGAEHVCNIIMLIMLKIFDLWLIKRFYHDMIKVALFYIDKDVKSNANKCLEKSSPTGQSDRALKLWAAAGGKHLNGLKLIVIWGFCALCRQQKWYLCVFVSFTQCTWWFHWLTPWLHFNQFNLHTLCFPLDMMSSGVARHSYTAWQPWLKEQP